MKSAPEAVSRQATESTNTERGRLASVTLYPTNILGGMQIFADWLAAECREAGWGVEEISSPLAAWQRNPAGHVLGGEAWQFVKVTREVARRAAEFKGFIVHAPAGICPWPGLTIHHLNVWESIRRRYSPVHPNYWRLRLLNENYARLSARGPRRNIAVSRHQVEGLRRLGIRVDEVIPIAIDVERFKPADRAAWREAMGWGEGEFVVLSVGRPARGKGWDRLFGLAREFPQVTFSIIGLPSAPRSAPPNVRSLGVIAHSCIHHYFQGADLFVTFSEVESFQRTLAEAMACGLPFIATETGLAADLLIDEADRRLFRQAVVGLEGDQESEVLKRMIDSPQLRSELGAAGREYIVRNAAAPLIAARYRELLDEVLGRG